MDSQDPSLLTPSKRRGALAPPVADIDLSTWDRPHSLVSHNREGLVLGTALGSIAVGNVAAQSLFGLGGPLGLEALFGLGPAFVVILIGKIAGRWRSGNLTVDPFRRAFIWQADRGAGAPTVWAFDDVIGLKLVPSWWSDAAELDFGDRRLLVRLPPDSGQRFIDALEAERTGAAKETLSELGD